MQAQARICPTCHDDHWPDRPCEETDIKYRIATLESEIARLRKALVLSVRHRDQIVSGTGGRVVHWHRFEKSGFAEFDGTDESLIETLCRLAQEGE